LVVGRQLGEHDTAIGYLTKLSIVEANQFTAEYDVVDGQPDIATDLTRDEVVIAGQNLDRDSVRRERLERGGGTVLRRIEEGNKPGEDQVRLVAHRVRPMTWIEVPVRDGADAKAILVEFGNA